MDTVDHPHVVQVTVRGGYCRYYSFGFVTGGGEVAVNTVGPLQVVAGVELFAVKRIPPPEYQLQSSVYSEWNNVVPMNLGALLAFPVGRLQPYVGADAVVAPYYKDGPTQHFALGGRLRGGLDVMVVDRYFGVNANLALGVWHGDRWTELQDGLHNTGPLPQISLGAFVGF